MKFCVILSVLLVSCVLGDNQNNSSASTPSASTVPTKSPNTTTVAPIITTTPTSTTPTPASKPGTGIWNVTNGDKVCILFDAGIRLTFANPISVVDVPTNITATGNCSISEIQQEIEFNFNYLTLKFNFTSGENGTKYNLSSFSLTGKGIKDVNDNLKEDALRTEDLGRSYLCSKMQEVYVMKLNQSEKYLESIKLVSVRYEAFRNSSTSEFGTPDTCSADSVSQLVPIIVGAALAGLIIIVLIAYLIGRKRSKRGYESV